VLRGTIEFLEDAGSLLQLWRAQWASWAGLLTPDPVPRGPLLGARPISGRQPIPLKVYFLIVFSFSLLLGTCKFNI
jgi:hypothetical protein